MRALREKLRRRDDDGFTIAEVMVALLIFALMSTGSIFATMSMLQITRDARNRQVAANLAAQEIDTVRSYSDTTAVVNRAFDPPAQNGTNFHVDRAVSWQSVPIGADEGQGCTLAPMRFVASVTVTVTWKGMRSQTSPVTSDTLLTARDIETNKNAGTIAVTVLGADGTGRSGVRAQSGGMSAVTNANGRAVLTNVPAGNQTVAIDKSGYVDELQNPKPKKDTLVSAGECTEVQFQYDQTTRANVYYAANYITDYDGRPYPVFPGISPAPPAGIATRAFASLPATFSNPNTGAYEAAMPATNTMVGTLNLHPFSSGYSVYAGDCDTADPTYWGAPALASFGTAPGGETEVYVPMGVVIIDTHGGSPNEIIAYPADPATLQRATAGNTLGCSALEYSFGSADGYTITNQVALALPYGSWIINYGGGAGSVPQGWLTALNLPANADRGLPAVQTTLDKKQGDVVVTVKPVVP